VHWGLLLPSAQDDLRFLPPESVSKEFPAFRQQMLDRVEKDGVLQMDDVRGLFSSNEILEAVFITASGKESEGLLGIATRWDMLRLK
jgi:hypothetical protein